MPETALRWRELSVGSYARLLGSRWPGGLAPALSLLLWELRSGLRCKASSGLYPRLADSCLWLRGGCLESSLPALPCLELSLSRSRSLSLPLSLSLSLWLAL